MVGVFFYSNKKASPVKARLTNHNLMKKRRPKSFQVQYMLFCLKLLNFE